MQKNERAARFNEVYKLLLDLLTVLISFSSGFLKEISPSLLVLYIIALFVWCLGTLIIKGEYVLKSFGFYWLAMSLFSAIYRVTFSTPTIEQPVAIIMALVSFFCFLPIVVYFSPCIGRTAEILEVVLGITFTVGTYYAIITWLPATILQLRR